MTARSNDDGHDDQTPRYRIGQVATMLAVRHAFLRRLDAHKVIAPYRTAGRQRRYSRRDVDEIRHVVELKAEGMTLAAVRRIFELEHRVRMLEWQLHTATKRAGGLETRLRRRRVEVPPLGWGPAL